MVVEMTDGFAVAGEAADGVEAVELTERLRPDLVLMDVKMPKMDGLEATRKIIEASDPPLVLILSTHESGSFAEPAVLAGAAAFIPKSDFSMEALETHWARLANGNQTNP